MILVFRLCLRLPYKVWLFRHRATRIDKVQVHWKWLMEKCGAHFLLQVLLWDRIQRRHLKIIKIAAVLIKLSPLWWVQLFDLADRWHTWEIAHNKVFVRQVSASLNEYLLTVQHMMLAIDRTSPWESTHHCLGLWWGWWKKLLLKLVFAKARQWMNMTQLLCAHLLSFFNESQLFGHERYYWDLVFRDQGNICIR